MDIESSAGLPMQLLQVTTYLSYSSRKKLCDLLQTVIVIYMLAVAGTFLEEGGPKRKGLMPRVLYPAQIPLKAPTKTSSRPFETDCQTSSATSSGVCTKVGGLNIFQAVDKFRCTEGLQSLAGHERQISINPF